jgi:hypothetical protein
MGKAIEKDTLSAEEILSLLTGEDHAYAYLFHKLGESLGCVIESKEGTARTVIRYSVKKPKIALFTTEIKKGKIRIKANLFNLNQYKELAEKCSDTLKNCIKSTRTCERCNPRCKQGSSFTLDGKEYLTCIGSGHFFGNMEEKDWNDLKELIVAENKVILSAC